MVRSPLAPKMTMTNGGRTRDGGGVAFGVGAVGLMIDRNGRFRLFRGHYEPLRQGK